MSTLVETVSPSATFTTAAPPPRRVLLLTQSCAAGVGRHFFDLAEGLQARGVEVVGIYSPRKLDTACRARLASSTMPPMHSFPMRRGLHPMDSADVWRLARLIARLGPFDVIHGHNSKGGALARLAAQRLRIPSIYTPNSFITQDQAVPGWQRHVFGRIERWLGRNTAAVIAVSHDEAEHARWLGIDSGKIHIVPNGVDPPAFPPRHEARSRLGISADELVVGFVGRLAPQKAPEVMVEAFAAAFPKPSLARLVMVGSGPLEAEVQRRIEQLGLGSRVLLLGDVVATTVMPAFDVFCLSSRYEGMPYVLIEALAAGLPIVTTRVGGATMCVEPMRNGLIVPPDDVASLSAALAKVASDAELRAGFAATSAGYASRFTAQKMVDQTLQVYAQVLAARTAHAGDRSQ